MQSITTIYQKIRLPTIIWLFRGYRFGYLSQLQSSTNTANVNYSKRKIDNVNFTMTIIRLLKMQKYFVFLILMIIYLFNILVPVNAATSTKFTNNFEFHKSLTSEEREILLGHRTNVPLYQMLPSNGGIQRALLSVYHRRLKRRVLAKRKRMKRSTSATTSEAFLVTNSDDENERQDSEYAHPIIVEFDAFSEHFRLHLWPNHKLLAPSFQMINTITQKSKLLKSSGKKRMSSNKNHDTASREQQRENLIDCFYQGYSENHPDSTAAISLCNGMQGVIEIKSGVFIVNPLPVHLLDRFLNDTKMYSTTDYNKTIATSNDTKGYDNIIPQMFHIVLRKNGDESSDYQCPHQRRLAIATRIAQALKHPSLSMHRRQSRRTHRSKRSIEVVTSDLNIIEGDSPSPSPLSTSKVTRKAAPIQLDEMNGNNVYEDIKESSPRNTSNSFANSSTSDVHISGKSRISSSNLEGVARFNITVETAVFIDESLYETLSKTFPIDTEQQIVLFVMTIMNSVQLLLAGPSLGPRPVEVSVVLLDLLKQQPKNLRPSDNIDTYLTNFCVWQHKKRLRESGGPTPDWDHALLLSGINMYVVDNLGKRKRHVVGLAPVSGMCNSLNSCTISEGTSFQTVLVAAHEMGHSLGMEHDGPQDGNSCNKDDFVMSPTLGPGKTTWSECSRQYLDKFVLTPQATCILGRSSHVNIIQQFIPTHQLPGERFSVDDQCQFRFGPTARHYSGQEKKEICRLVKCHVKPNRDRKTHHGYYSNTGKSIYNPYPPKSTYNTHPALEGTECSPQMWCREGRCIPKTNLLASKENAIQSLMIDNQLNDVEHLSIARNKMTGKTSNFTSDITRPRVLRTKNTSILKLNKLKPKPTHNPHRYKYNPKNTGNLNMTSSFGSRMGGGVSSSSGNNNLKAKNESSHSELTYLSVNKYNPYNEITSHVVTKNWKASQKTSPRPTQIVHGNWSHWTAYGPCVSECVTVEESLLNGGAFHRAPMPIGVMTAQRKCNNPIPLNGGDECHGSDTKVKLCNAYQICSLENSYSAASGLAANSTRLKINHEHVRYRIRTVDEYITDTCFVAARLNDKLENHGTQYPSYDSASHSCYVWCHKRGGGYISQGWRLPDGTPCGRKIDLPEKHLNSVPTSTSTSKLNTGFCYNGQCLHFNCLGEMRYRASSTASNSGNVYSGASSTYANYNGTHYDDDDGGNVDCNNSDVIISDLGVHAKTNEFNGNSVIGSAVGELDSSYRLVSVRPKGSIVPNNLAKSSNQSPESDKQRKQQHNNKKFSPTLNGAMSASSSSGTTEANTNFGFSEDILGPAQKNFFNSIGIETPWTSYSNWSEWISVTECQYSTACITTGRGFRLVTRECKRQNTCAGRREALQLCKEINQNMHRDKTLFDLYEQYCPATKRITSEAYASQICNKYRIKYPSLLSGNGRQLLGKNSGCIVACEDRMWKDIHYQMDAFEEGKFPFGTDCSESESSSDVGYCLNGKCIRFDQKGISYDTPNSILYRSEILQLFAPDSAALPALSIPTSSSINKSSSSSLISQAVDFAGMHDNSLLYATITNELYKRATSQHNSAPFPVTSTTPETSLNSNDRNALPLTYATPRRRADVDLSGTRIQLRRIKRSSFRIGNSKSQNYKNPSRFRPLGSTDPTSMGNSDLLFRKASLQEHFDPESDYVSWTLVRHHQRTSHLGPRRESFEQAKSSPAFSMTTMSSWKPLIKESIRPIRLSRFSSARPTRPVEFEVRKKKAEHLQTFTLVKHNKDRLMNTLRSWPQTANHIALPLGNHTTFLDDEDYEDEGYEGSVEGKKTNTNNKETSKNSNNKALESTETKFKRKNRKDFGLGHESWPNDYSSNDNIEQSDTDEHTGNGKNNGKERIELRVEPYVWSVILSECSRSCGPGIRTVRVVCTVGQRTVEDRLCDVDSKPIHKKIEPCKERDCIGRWRTESWSACSAKCNANSARNSYQSRTIICVGPAISQSADISPRSSTIDQDQRDKDENEAEVLTTENPYIPTTTATTDEPPSNRHTTRVYSILSHHFCDPNNKPSQWRSCTC